MAHLVQKFDKCKVDFEMSDFRHYASKLRREWVRLRVKTYLKHQALFGKTCFIHINKCGGTSVEAALGMPLIHDTAQQRIAKVGRARWDAMMTFTLVRNPYAKAVSHYKYRVKTGQTGLDADTITLDDWIVAAYGDKDPQYYNNALMFQPCLDWITDTDGTVLVKKIIKLEEIDAEWDPFCQTAFGALKPLPHKNQTRKTQKKSPEALGDAARAVLRSHFAKDFEAFGYAP